MIQPSALRGVTWDVRGLSKASESKRHRVVLYSLLFSAPVASRASEPKRRHGVGLEHGGVLDVSPQHRDRAVPGLLSDGPLRRAVARRLSNEASPQRMTGERSRCLTNERGGTLHDIGDSAVG